jgi:hypothetical protein
MEEWRFCTHYLPGLSSTQMNPKTGTSNVKVSIRMCNKDRASVRKRLLAPTSSPNKVVELNL